MPSSVSCSCASQSTRVCSRASTAAWATSRALASAWATARCDAATASWGAGAAGGGAAWPLRRWRRPGAGVCDGVCDGVSDGVCACATGSCGIPSPAVASTRSASRVWCRSISCTANLAASACVLACSHCPAAPTRPGFTRRACAGGSVRSRRRPGWRTSAWVSSVFRSSRVLGRMQGITQDATRCARLRAGRFSSGKAGCSMRARMSCAAWAVFCPNAGKDSSSAGPCSGNAGAALRSGPSPERTPVSGPRPAETLQGRAVACASRPWWAALRRKAPLQAAGRRMAIARA